MYRTLESCGSLNPMYIVMCTKTRRVLHCWPNTLPSLFDVFSIQQTRTRIKTCTCYVCASDNFSSCKNLIFKGKVPYPEVLDKLKGEVLFFCLSRSWRQIFRRLYYFFFYFFENIVLWKLQEICATTWVSSFIQVMAVTNYWLICLRIFEAEWLFNEWCLSMINLN